MNIKRIDLLNHVSTLLIFAIVASLTLYGYLSLQSSAAVGSAVGLNYRWYQSFERIDLALEAEQYAVERYAIVPSSQSERSVAQTRQRFDAELASTRRLAGATAVASVLARIQRLHDVCDAILARVETLQFAHHTVAASLVYGTVFLPAFGKLGALIEEAGAQRLDRAHDADIAFDQTDTRLRWTMVALGIFGLIVLAGLLYTVHVYKMRAAEAVRHEIQRLQEMALIDNLTGLGNHRSFHEDFAREVARSRRHGHALTLALLDIDRFKELNDAGGHRHGDDILVGLARVLQSGRQEDRAYRVGGDEFAILLVDCGRAQAATAIERIRRSLRKGMVGTTASFGYCELEAESDEHDLYESADAALYEAKSRGRNAVVDFSTMRGVSANFSPRKTAALRSVLDTRAISAAFQPIWDINTQDIIGFEGLARPDPAAGFSGPQELFDVAEYNHKVVELDCLCLDTIVAAARWLPQGKRLFINMTPEALASIAFKSEGCLSSLAAVGLKAGQIVIEVTERQIGDVGELVRRLQSLRDLGLLLALDDTGSGSAGLEVLGAFSFDFVKIDRTIIMRAVDERRARGVIAGIMAIAREIGAYVIAEGIERIEQLDFLRGVAASVPSVASISGAQGYLLGRPVLGEPNLNEIRAYGEILAPTHKLAS